MSLEEFTDQARRQLERVKVLCAQSGLRYVELPPAFLGAGVAIGFDETDYVVVSVAGGGGEGQLLVTSGLLNDVARDRAAALEAANHFTSNNPAYPVFLHDADAGWALLAQQSIPVQLAVDVPAYFIDFCVKALPQVVAEYRQTVAEKWGRLGGRPWRWTPEDHSALLLRSMM